MILFVPINVGPEASLTVTPGVEMTGQDLVREALLELGVLNPTQDVSGDDASYGLSKLNRLLDRWNARGECSFATGFTEYTLTASLHPHTIGPSGTFEVHTRPMRIDGANLIISDVRYPIAIRDQPWYQGLSTPELSTTIPTDLYYEPASPNGKLWLYPVPSSAYAIELWTKGLFAAMELTSQLVAPQGYRDAIVKTLAEELQAPFRVPMPESLPRLAREARATVLTNNRTIPRLCTRDAGMPGGGGGYYNYLTGVSE